jgi:hypothetical protein
MKLSHHRMHRCNADVDVAEEYVQHVGYVAKVFEVDEQCVA